MIFPLSYASVLLVAVVSLVLGALWAPMFRAAGKWRFELFGIDFGLGVILGALGIGFTLGAMGDEITFYDNLMIMRKSSLLFLLGLGAVLNLGMLFLLGALSQAGIAMTFLMGLGVSTAVSAIGMHLEQPMMGTAFLVAGCLLLFAGVFLAASAHSSRLRQRDTELLQKAVAAGVKGKLPVNTPLKGTILAIAGGLMIGLVQPIAIWAQNRDEIGFGAYSMGILLAASFVAATPFFTLFLLNLPVQGEALSFGAWIRGSAKQHLLGIGSGCIWYAALIALLLAVTANPAAGVGGAVAFSIARGSLILGALIGIFAYGEFAGFSAPRSRAMAALAAATAGLLIFLVSRA